MNNLKRVLSLVMSGAMLVGMLTIGANAANTTFSDADEITHTEAVNTMAALGVIKGRDNGQYDPAGNISRAEMAKIICVMLNGGEDPAWGSGMQTTFTDTQNHWAKNYIAYCANKGIIAGLGDGTFNPNGLVTGAQAAKMMLVALDYDPDIFKLVGAKWEDNTNDIATSKGLYKSIKGLNTSAPLNRDNAAQMAYNCLEARPMVRSFDKVASNGEISYNYQESTTETFLSKYFEADTWVGSFDGNYKTLGGTLKEGMIQVTGDLEGTNPASPSAAKFYADLDISNVGEEVKVLFYDKNNDGEPDKNDVIYGVYNTGKSEVLHVTAADIKSASDFTDANKVKIDGTKYDCATPAANDVIVVTNYGATADVTASSGTAAEVKTAISALSAQTGAPVKVILNGDGEVVKAYIVNSTLGVVTAKNAEKVTISNSVGSVKFKNNDVYEGIKKDDIVVVTKLYDSDNDKAFITVKKAETVSGTVKGYKGTKNVKLDGTTYDVHTTLLTSASMPSDAVPTFTTGHIGEDFDLYLVDGYVAGAVKTSESASNYSLLLGVSDDADVPGDGLNGLKIEVLGADGTKSILTVSEDSYKKGANTDSNKIKQGSDLKTGAGSTYEGVILTYTMNKDGEAEVKVQESSTSAAVHYTKKTKTVNDGANDINTASNCVLFVNEAASGSPAKYKAYNIRDLGNVAKPTSSSNSTPTALNSTVVRANGTSGDVVAVYMNLGTSPDGATSSTVYGIVSADNGKVEVDGVEYNEYVVDVNTEPYTVHTKDTLAEGKIVSFDPASDNVYAAGKVTDVGAAAGTTASASATIKGWVDKYNEDDKTITVRVGTDTSTITNNTATIFAVKSDADIYFVDQDNDKGVDGSIGAYDAINKKMNVIIITDANKDVTTIIFETSNEKDIADNT